LAGEKKQKHGSVGLEGEAEAYSLPPSKGLFLQYDSGIFAAGGVEKKVFNIRHQKVMLDFELAEIYGYSTKRFNEQVKNNAGKFDEDFLFQLTRDEWEILRSKNSTSRSEQGSGGRRYLPYAFKEQGIYMLMTVLKGELATKQSKAK